MSSDNQSGENKSIKYGYAPNKKGYQPGGGVTGGHKPEKSQLKPSNPPKKK